MKSAYSKKATIKPQERADNILHVYATQDSKVPIRSTDWHLIEQYTLHMLPSHSSTSVEDLLVARSGYDAAHQCTFIAAETAASEEWHKAIIARYQEGNKRFSALATGEHPTLFLLPVYLPTRYNIITPQEATKQLRSYNPFLGPLIYRERKQTVGEGRDLFYCINREAFLKVIETYKLNFPLGKVDCNNATLKASAAIARPAAALIKIPPPLVNIQS
jgi:hypothetical protein